MCPEVVRAALNRRLARFWLGRAPGQALWHNCPSRDMAELGSGCETLESVQDRTSMAAAAVVGVVGVAPSHAACCPVQRAARARVSWRCRSLWLSQSPVSRAREVGSAAVAGRSSGAGTPRIAKGDPVLTAEMLSKTHDGQSMLFEGLTFTVCRGERVALVGKNGVGKSSLLRLLAGADSASGGQVTRRKGLTIGYCPQDPPLDPGEARRAPALEM